MTWPFGYIFGFVGTLQMYLHVWGWRRWSSWPDDAAINPAKHTEVFVNRWSICVSSKEKNIFFRQNQVEFLRMSYLRKAEMACQVLTWIQGEIVRQRKTYELAVLKSARGKSNTLEHGHQLVNYSWKVLVIVPPCVFRFHPCQRKKALPSQILGPYQDSPRICGGAFHQHN